MALTLNTLTNLMPSLYKNLDVVSREIVGFIPAVTLDATADRYAFGQTVYSHVAPAIAAGDGAATMTLPSPSAQTIGTKSLSISKDRTGTFGWTGEDEAKVASGPGLSSIKANQIQQCFRTLINEMETDLGALATYASRAGLIADTTFLKTDLSDLVNLRTILVENGAAGDWQLVLGSQEVAKLLKQTQLTKVSEAGTDVFVRQGVFANLFNFNIRESAGVSRPAIGTAAGATVGTAAYAIGDTVLTLASAGSGTIVDGDVITLAGDTNQYVVASGDASVAGGGTITLAQPGLKLAITGASSPAITILGIGDRPMAFSRSAIVLATRLPKMPEGGDAAIDSTTMTDPRSGISFDVRVYAGTRMQAIQICACWGMAAIKSEHIAVGLGY